MFHGTTKADAQADLSLRCVHMSAGTFSHVAAQVIGSIV